MREGFRKIYRSKDGKVEMFTNDPNWKPLTRAEKIDGLLEAGLIDEAEAIRLRAPGGEDPRHG